ncbi:MAG: substrate-binding domain-containing protein, partial [Actinomycetota bacterium]|nr:substrate-binding domain-containing protein [Actinomycetota bacterium]
MKARRFTMLVLALALTAAACGGDDDTTDDTIDVGTTDTSASEAPGDASGSIAISGSSTVEQVSALVAQRYSDANPGVAITVDGPGTGDGFQLFCTGETDISNASRPIQDEEVALCADNGIDFVELQVGIDGLSVL